MNAAEPFPPDPALAARRGERLATLGAGFPARLEAVLDATGRDAVHPAAVIPAAAVARLVADLGLEVDDGVEVVMLLAIETARGLARPPVSGYHVGAVGLAAGSGDLVLGGEGIADGGQFHIGQVGQLVLGEIGDADGGNLAVPADPLV